MAASKTFDEIAFPILAFYGKEMLVYREPRELLETTRAALKGGLFDGLQICASDGRHFVVTRARKVRGIGALGGWNVFLNQRIEVELDVQSSSPDWDEEELRKLVARELRGWSGWKSRGDFPELVKGVREARGIGELVSFLARAV